MGRNFPAQGSRRDLPGWSVPLRSGLASACQASAGEENVARPCPPLQGRALANMLGTASDSLLESEQRASSSGVSGCAT